MSSTAIATIVKMMEGLPESVQQQVVEHLREYLDDKSDEMQWDESFKRTESRLVSEARRVRGEIAAGKDSPLDLDAL
jgi:hypothetical protein